MFYNFDERKLAEPLAVIGGPPVVGPLSGIKWLKSRDFVQPVPVDLLARVKREIGRDGREPWVEVCASRRTAETIAAEAILLQREADEKEGLDILRVAGPTALQALIRDADRQTGLAEVPLSKLDASDVAAIKRWCGRLDIGLVLHCDYGEDRTWIGACKHVHIAVMSVPKSITPVADTVLIVGFDPKLRGFVSQLVSGQRELALEPPGPLTAVPQDGLRDLEWALERYTPWSKPEFCPEAGLSVQFEPAKAELGDLAWKGVPAPRALLALATELGTSARWRGGRRQGTVTHEFQVTSVDSEVARAFLTGAVKVGRNVRDSRFRTWAGCYSA